MAIRVPVLPIPALQWTTIGENLLLLISGLWSFAAESSIYFSAPSSDSNYSRPEFYRSRCSIILSIMISISLYKNSSCLAVSSSQLVQFRCSIIIDWLVWEVWLDDCCSNGPELCLFMSRLPPMVSSNLLRISLSPIFSLFNSLIFNYSSLEPSEPIVYSSPSFSSYPWFCPKQ